MRALVHSCPVVTIGLSRRPQPPAEHKRRGFLFLCHPFVVSDEVCPCLPGRLAQQSSWEMESLRAIRKKCFWPRALQCASTISVLSCVVPGVIGRNQLRAGSTFLDG